MTEEISMPFDLITFLQNILDPKEWTLPNILAAIAAIAAAIAAIAAIGSAIFSYLPIHQQRQRQQFLEKSFGGDLYDSATIKLSTRYYIPPNCSSIDPAQEAEPRHLITTEEKLFDAVDKHLAPDSPHRHVLLLADSGMGKSSFVLNYYAHNQKMPKRKRQRLAVVPLGISNPEDYIAKIQEPQRTVIFLDAFDEDTKAIEDHRERLFELMQVCASFKRVLITCRTQFFLKDEEIPRETSIIKFGPRKPGEPRIYEFWRLYISPFNDIQVKKFLRLRYSFWPWSNRKKAHDLINKVPLLTARPMLLTYIPDLLEDGKNIKYSFQIYEIMVDKWLERERSWVDKESLRSFSEQLAIDLYINRERRGSERISIVELAEFTKQYNIQIEQWKITGRSLLNRDAVGNLKFSHRSIMEYLFIKKFTEGDMRCRNVQWTDYMKMFLLEIIHHQWISTRTLSFGLEGADLTKLGVFGLPPLYQYRSVSKKLDELSLSEATRTLQTPKVNLYESQHQPNLNVDVVIDHASGLMWQQSGSEDAVSLKRAINYIEKLNIEEAKDAVNRGWRLPTVEEAMSIIEYGQTKFVKKFFDIKQQFIWTADRDKNGDTLVVSLDDGQCFPGLDTQEEHEQFIYGGYLGTYTITTEYTAYVRAVCQISNKFI